MAERQRFVSSMPPRAARKNVRSSSVGLNQKRCRASIGPGMRAGTPASARSRGAGAVSKAAATCVM